MSKKILVIISVMVISFLGMGLYISSQLQPEELKKVVLETIGKQFPNTTAELGQVNVGLGFNLNVEFKKLEIKLRPEFSQGKDPLLFSVERFELKIPFWAILTSGGTITLGAKTPIVNYITFNKDQTNWLVATGKIADNEKEVKSKTTEKSEKLSLPAFITKSKINVRLEDINAGYSFYDGEKGKIVIEKFLLKDFNFNSSMAFEVATFIDTKIKSGKNIKARIMAIGQVDVKKYIDSGVLSVSLITDLSDIFVSDLPVSVPNIKSNIQAEIFPDKRIQVSLDSTGADQTFDLKLQTLMQDKKIKVSALQLKTRPAKMLISANESLKDKLKGADFSSFEFNLTGDVELDSANDTITPQLKWESHGDLVYNVIDQVKTINSLSGELAGQKLFTKILTKTLGGTISTEVTGEVNLKDKALSEGKYPKLNVNVVGLGLKVEKSFLQDFLYAKKTGNDLKEQNVASQTNPEQLTKDAVAPSNGKITDFPTTNVSMHFKDVKIGDVDFSLNSSIETLARKISVKNLNFKLGEGGGSATLEASKISPEALSGVFSFNLIKLNLSAFNPFLPNKLKSISGITDSKLNGSFTKGKLLTYNVDFESSTTGGKLEGLKLAEYVQPFLEKIPYLKDKAKDKDLDVSDEFELFQVKGKATEKDVNFAVLKFVGVKNSVSMSGKGVVALRPADDSEVFFDLTDKKQKLAEILKKNIGRDTLPVRAFGKGMSLAPDISYTLKIASAGLIKSKGREAVEKIIKSEKVEKLINNSKVNDLIKSNAGKLLDGFFK